MKRNAVVIARDNTGNKTKVRIQFDSKWKLTQSEINNVTRKLARSVADAVRELPCTDFGPDNTIVSAPRT